MGLSLSLGLSLGSAQGGASPGPVNTVAPAITGTPLVGQVLTVSNGTWTGTGTISYTRQWRADGVAISGATSSTYTVQSGDANKVISAVIAATDDEGVRTASAAGVAIQAAPVNTAAPTISGTTTQGETLTATTGTWTGTPSPAFAYQWQRGTTNISGATLATYTLQAGDVGSTVRCVVTATNVQGSASANSANSAAVTALPVAPSLSGVPTISGTTTQGEILTATAATASGTPAPTRTWQWRRNGSAISGATSATYTLQAADVGAVVSVTQTETNASGSASATSTNTATIAASGDETSPLILNRIGQSNAVTAAQNASTGIARYGSSLTDMHIWNHSAGAWEPYTIGVNTGTQGSADGGAYSVEAEVVYQMRLAGNTRPVYVIKECVSGNGVDPVDSNGNWWPGGAYSGGGTYLQGSRWTEWLAQRSAALSASGAPVEAEEKILLNQGEADISEIASSRRQDNMTAFMAKVRAEVTPTGQFIFERPRPGVGGLDYGGTDKFAWSYTLREADTAVALADVNATLVDADFIFPANTQVHPAVSDQTWVQNLGQRVYAAMFGIYDATYGSITDTTPSAFAFADTSSSASTLTTSNVVSLAGFERRTTISITGGEYQITNVDDSVAVAWTSASGTLEKFQKVQLRATSSGTTGATVNVDLTVGGVSDTWTITTTAFSAANAETTAFSATVASNGGTTLSISQQQKLDTLYTSLKSAGLIGGDIGSRKVKRLFLNAGGDSIANRIDIADPSYLAPFTATGGGDMPWTSAGFNPGGAAQRAIDMGLTAANWPQDNVAVFAWTTPTPTAQSDITSSDDTIQWRQTTALQRAKLNISANQNRTGTYSGAGLWMTHRQGTTTTNFYGPSNTTLGATNSGASNTPTATAVYLGNPIGLTSDRDIPCWGMLGDISDADRAAFYAAINEFFAA